MPSESCLIRDRKYNKTTALNHKIEGKDKFYQFTKCNDSKTAKR